MKLIMEHASRYFSPIVEITTLNCKFKRVSLLGLPGVAEIALALSPNYENYSFSPRNVPHPHNNHNISQVPYGSPRYSLLHTPRT